jgi:hypothetical protein
MLLEFLRYLSTRSLAVRCSVWVSFPVTKSVTVAQIYRNRLTSDKSWNIDNCKIRLNWSRPSNPQSGGAQPICVSSTVHVGPPVNITEDHLFSLLQRQF